MPHLAAKFVISLLSKVGKGIKNREHHACPVMPPLAAKFSISVLSKWGNSRDDRNKKLWTSCLSGHAAAGSKFRNFSRVSHPVYLIPDPAI
jgi:hypothetical protein